MILLLNTHFLLLLFGILSISLSYPFKWHLSEKFISFILKCSGLTAIFLCGFSFFQESSQSYLLLGIIPLSLALSSFRIYLFMIVLLATVSHFSLQYVHKEIGFYKFFLNFLLFWIGLFLFNFSGDNLVIFAGWEFIGISSIFLISYYHYRKAPIFSSLYVVAFYKFADILLITSLLFLKNSDNYSLGQEQLQFLYLALIIAGLIKSASFPFTSWLPRAMEGPTPSSAIYYAALSINTGVLLIIKFLPQILLYDLCKETLFFVGVLTVLYSSIQSRVQSDIKSSLAYSTSVQIGFVLIELSLGFSTFALIHLFSSSILKIYQFIRTPSLLHIYHSMEGEYGKTLSRTGLHFQYLVPKKLRNTLYFFALNHFYLDTFYSKLKHTIRKIGYLSKLLLYPLIESSKQVKYRSLLWGGYYSLVVILVSLGVIEVKKVYFDIIPLAILFISMAILFEKNYNSFIALFAIYKTLESLIIHSVHTHDPFKIFSIILAGVFSISLVIVCKRQDLGKKRSYFASTLTIFMMLFFTNFPFLLQSLVNEHIIESLITQGNITSLLMYCLANTFLNLGLYNFVFEKVYIQEAIDS